MKNIKVSDVTYLKLKKRKNEDNCAEETFDKWLNKHFGDIRLHDTDGDSISKYTVQHLDPLWMGNLARNLPFILKDGKSIKQLVDTEKDKASVIVGAGPSIYKHKHIEMLKESNFKGIVCSSDKMLIPLLKNDVIPNYVISIDAHSQLIPAFYKHPLVKKNADKIKVVIGTFVSPNLTKLLRKLGLDTYWFSATGERRMILLTVSEHNPNGLLSLRSTGNTGALSWVFSWSILKCNPTCWIGMDMGYPEGTNLEDTPYYSGILNTPDKTVSALAASPKYEVIYNPAFKCYAKVDPVFKGYRTELLRAIENDLPSDIIVYNCTEGGTLFGKKIKCVPFKEFLRLV